MKALSVLSYDPNDSIHVVDLPDRIPKPGEVRVSVHACGVSFVDLLLARGKYQVKPALPFTPGSEFSGTVNAIGEGVDDGLKIGDPVCGTFHGAWSASLCVPRTAIFAMPDGLPIAEGSVLVALFSTALYAVRDRAHLLRGETLLVLGAAGAVGSAAVQIGKALGARVIAVASSDAKRNAALADGADHVVDSQSEWKDAVKNLAGARGVDVVFDPVGGDATDQAFRTLGWGGRHLMVGFAGGSIAALKTNLAIVKGSSLVGVDLRQAAEKDPMRILGVKNDVLALYKSGQIRVNIYRSVPADHIAEAEHLMKDRSLVGRVIITF